MVQKKHNKQSAGNCVTNTGVTKKAIEDFLYSDSPTATATKFALAIIAMGGIVFIGALAPNVYKSSSQYNYRTYDKKRRKPKYTQKQINNALLNLKRQKLIQIKKDTDGQKRVILTNKGKKRHVTFAIDTITIKKPKKWDGKWYIVFFDVPNKYNTGRRALRYKIKQLGFKQLQKSAWIYPYECEDEILFIAEEFHIERYVEIVRVDRLVHEKQIRKAFKI